MELKAEAASRISELASLHVLASEKWEVTEHIQIPIYIQCSEF